MDTNSLFSTGEPGLDGRLQNRPKDQAHRRREKRLKKKEETKLLGEKAGQNSDIFAGKKLHIGPPGHQDNLGRL